MRDDARSTPLLRRLLWLPWSDRRRLLRWECRIGIVALHIVLACAWLLPQDFTWTQPVYLWAAWLAFMVRTFTFHTGLALLVLAAAAWLLGDRRLAAGSLPVILLATLPTLWAARPKSPPPIDGPSLRVMSINLMSGNPRERAILEEIHRAEADLLLIQEMTVQWAHALRPLEASYPHRRAAPRPGAFGAAIYSRLPFTEPVRGALPLSDVDIAHMRAVVRFGDRELAVYNLHLIPPHMLGHLADRRGEFDNLLSHLRREPLPCIVAGDLNFTHTGPQAAALRRLGLREIHHLAGAGLGSTWPVNGLFRYLPVPGLRIDHIYLSPELTAAAARTGIGAGSDHRPVIATIGFAPNGG